MAYKQEFTEIKLEKAETVEIGLEVLIAIPKVSLDKFAMIVLQLVNTKSNGDDILDIRTYTDSNDIKVIFTRGLDGDNISEEEIMEGLVRVLSNYINKDEYSITYKESINIVRIDTLTLEEAKLIDEDSTTYIFTA